jgi:hypothetical protein
MHTQYNAGGIVRKSKAQFLPESKPHASKLLTQFLRHLPTHHPKVEINRFMIPNLTKSKFLKISVEMKNGGMAWHCLQRAVWQKRALPRWITLSYNQI